MITFHFGHILIYKIITVGWREFVTLRFFYPK